MKGLRWDSTLPTQYASGKPWRSPISLACKDLELCICGSVPRAEYVEEGHILNTVLPKTNSQAVVQAFVRWYPICSILAIDPRYFRVADAGYDKEVGTDWLET